MGWPVEPRSALAVSYGSDTGRRPTGGAHRTARKSRALLAVVAVLAAGLSACRPIPPPPPPPPDRPVPPEQTFAGPNCLTDPTVSRVACENTAPGNPPSQWDITGIGDPSIQGFASDISVNRGQSVVFRIKTDAARYHLEIYRLGFYGGMGARLVAVVRPPNPIARSQPPCAFDPVTELLDCANWAPTATWAVPPEAVSGIYVAKVVRDSGQVGASHIVFVVRDDAAHSDLLFQTSDTTWQAYNNYGGVGAYIQFGGHQAYYMSYNRPFTTRGADSGRSWLFSAEYPMVRWLESNGYDVNYSTGVDTDRDGAALLRHKTFLSVGHDEYWSGRQRANVEAARAAGVNLAFFSGNEISWKTRWVNNNRWLVTYKESLLNDFFVNNRRLDPSGIWTGLWRDPRFSPPADGGRPENALSGTLYTSLSTGAIAVPADEGRFRFWRNTSIAALTSGATATLPRGTLGYEWDEDVDTGSIASVLGIPPAGARFRPPGEIRLSSTTPPLSTQALDTAGVSPGVHSAGDVNAQRTLPATHHLTLYRAPSGALVFSAGTIQWSWGLDSHHDGTASPADPRMQQATLNLLADMGAQPRTIQPGLVPATASTDTTPPSSTITTPVDHATLRVATATTISGTATDVGGLVAGIEVSTDSGQTWNPVTGTDHWTFAWTPTTRGTTTILVRATDDSANLEHPGTPITVTVT